MGFVIALIVYMLVGVIVWGWDAVKRCGEDEFAGESLGLMLACCLDPIGLFLAFFGLLIWPYLMVVDREEGVRRIKSRIKERKQNEAKEAERWNHPLIGQTGVVKTPLRPAGEVVVGGESFSAISEGGFVDKGALVEILGHDTGNFRVKAVESS